jgi:hypothetical protein
MRAVFSIGAILLSLGLFVGVPISDVQAQEEEACGYFYYVGEEEPYPIEDCEHPFGIRPINPDLHVFYDDVEIRDGGVYTFLNRRNGFSATGTHAEAFYSSMSLYKKVGNEYRSFDSDLNFVTFTEPGTYTLVVYEEPEVFQVYNPFRRFLDILIPTAYAFDGLTTVFTFEVTDVVEKPRGISNILFLPGIQASRLYTKDEDGDEEKLWEPGGDDDVLRLAMTETGESVEAIYAKEVIEEVGEAAIGDNIYKGFLKYLVDIEGPFLGPIIETLPYDWRHDVFDVVTEGITTDSDFVTRPTTTIAFLAGTSQTGKVTIIAHSNGGLLAKALMLQLEDEGKANLVDKVIFIAVPHIGTPKGIMALLHGYDQGHALGLVSTDKGVRKVMKNMPGVYGLLPSEKYVSTLSEPLISFDDSPITENYRNAYGFTVTGMDEYTRFLKGIEGRTYADDRVNEASTANGTMLEKALQKHKDELDNWEAPEGVEVFNIVGTGLPTPNSIEYRGFSAPMCIGCQSFHKIEPVIKFTNYGDQTVVSKSVDDTGVNNIYFNLLRANAGIRNSNREHANITETETVQSLVDHILHGSSTDSIEYVTNTEPTFNTNTDIITIHSPARISVHDSEGNITGKTNGDEEWKSEIPGSSYFEAGEVKYALVPSEGTYNVIIEGEGTGVYTHEARRLQGSSEELQRHFTATATPTMIAKYTKKEGVVSNVSVDEDGDGDVDVVLSPDGIVVPEMGTYTTLHSVLDALIISSKEKMVLIGIAHKAEKYSQTKSMKLHRLLERATLLLIKYKVELYQKNGTVTEEAKNEVTNIINELLKKKLYE